MAKTGKKDIEKWIETWKLAGSELKQVKCQELRMYDSSKNQSIVDEMLQWAVDHQKVRLTSGLVEQQHFFTKMKEKQKQ